MIVKSRKQSYLHFVGNSLFALGNNSTVGTTNSHYVPQSVYGNILNGYCFRSIAVSGRTQTQINASLATDTLPYIDSRDIVIMWEGTNDIMVNALTGAQAYANLVTACNQIRVTGARLVLLTAISRGDGGDPATTQTRISDYNALILANQSSICDALYNPFADSRFNTVAATSNATYYVSGNVHPTTAGQAIFISEITSAIQSLYQ